MNCPNPADMAYEVVIMSLLYQNDVATLPLAPMNKMAGMLFWNAFSKQKLFVFTEVYFQGSNWHMVQEMVWCQPGGRPLFEPLLTQIYVALLHLTIFFFNSDEGKVIKYSNSNGFDLTIFCGVSVFASITFNDFLLITRDHQRIKLLKILIWSRKFKVWW